MKRGDGAGAGVSIGGQHREQTQLTDTLLRAGGSGEALLEGGTATAKVTPRCTADQVRTCDEDVGCWMSEAASAGYCAGFRLSACWREKGAF